MSIQFGERLPDFVVETAMSQTRFHGGISGGRKDVFSHSKSFSPANTLGQDTMARLANEFDACNVKVIGPGNGPLETRDQWAGDIMETPGYPLNVPLKADPDLRMTHRVGMIHPNTDNTSGCGRFLSSALTKGEADD